MPPIRNKVIGVAVRPTFTKSKATSDAQDEKPSKSATKIRKLVLGAASKPRSATKSPRRRAIFIALDCGTTFLKGGVWVGDKDGTTTRPTSPRQLEAINWPNDYHITRARAAMLTDNTWAFGDDIPRALEMGQITEADIMYQLKPMAYDGEMQQRRQADEDRMRQQAFLASFGNLKIQDQLAACGESVPTEKVPQVHSYAGLMKWCWKAAAIDVSRKHPELKWNDFSQSTKDEQFPPPNQDVRVAILVPATTLCSVQHRQFMTAAAETAGIPNFEFLSEPAAALTYHLLNYRPDTPMRVLLGKTVMMMDAGAGSVDWVVWTILNMSPLRVRVEVSGVTAWLGASQVNTHARTLILEGVRDLEGLLEHLSFQHCRTITQVTFDKELDDIIEEHKCWPRGVEGRYLPIQNLPMDVHSRLHGTSGVWLSKKDMKMIHKQYADPIISTTLDIAARVADMKSSRGDQTLPIHQIFATGGGVLNSHFQENFRKDVGDVSWTKWGYIIPVDFPTATSTDLTSSYPCLTQVAQGGLLVLADDELEAERVIDRSYFFANLNETCVQDDATTVCEPTYFARKGQPFQPEDAIRIPCKRRHYDRGLDEYEIHEEIYFSDSITEDRVILDRDALDKLLDSSLPWKYTLSKKDLAGMTLSSADPDPLLNRFTTCWIWDYLLDMTFDGRHVHFLVTIPRNGVLGPGQDAGPNPIQRSYKVDIKGAMRPLGATAE
ncbi:hypothetical protein H2200_000675 [Cladophialophora chaetospira]|uniref:Actin-like ATPase domain-containing protein n=1 Tax=Cladophialophora chaetospira TaxID=386627 RepID=A0AA38XNW4_9EURO|nr:hypothetical protein H2200_000675 [Cladophialophora chaetospira]